VTWWRGSEQSVERVARGALAEGRSGAPGAYQAPPSGAHSWFAARLREILLKTVYGVVAFSFSPRSEDKGGALEGRARGYEVVD